MGNSAVIAWGERQAFSSHKRKAAFHKDQMPPLAFHVAVSFSSGEVSPPTTKVGWGVSPNFLILPMLNLGLQCSSSPPLEGGWAPGLGAAAFNACFPGLPMWWESGDRSPWRARGLPSGLWPQLISRRLPVLSLYLFKVTKQHKTGNAKPNRKPSWRGNF